MSYDTLPNSVKEAYKYLENKKFTKAIRVLESPDCSKNAAAHALRALCCVYDNNLSEIQKEFSILPTLDGFDENSINQLIFACSFMNDFKCLVPVLQKLYEKNPKDRKIGEQYYLALLYNKEWKKMQSLSLRLYQTHKNDAFKLYETGICTLVDSVSEVKSVNELKLIEMMTKQIYDSYKTKDIRIMRNIQWGYIQILIMNKKYELAEQEIQERLKNYIVSQYLYDDWKQLLVLYTFMDKIPSFLSLFEEHLLSIYKKIDWDFFLLYNEVMDQCILNILSNETVVYKDQEKYDVRSSFLQKIRDLYNKEENPKYTREFLLFEIENEYYYTITLQKKDHIEDYIQKLYHFIDLFKHKGSCYKDIYKYISCLYESHHDSLMDHFRKQLNSLKENNADKEFSIDSMMNATLFLTLLYDLNAMTDDDLAYYYDVYQKAVLSNTDSARDQEILSLDYLILILTKYLKRKSMNEFDPLQKTLLIHTYLVMLENAYSKRPHNMKLALCLANEYSQLYLFDKAYMNYHEMGVTQMELLCLGYIYYLHTFLPSLYLPHNEFKNEYDLFMIFKTNSIQDCGEKLIQSLNNFTFMSTKTIFQYQQKIANSVEFYYPFLLNAYKQYYSAMDNDRKELMLSLANSLQTIPENLTLTHSDPAIYSCWIIEETPIVSLTENQTLSKLFYLQKQMLLLYIDIYTGKTENKKDHLALLDQCLPTVQSLLTMKSKWIKSYGQILLVFLTLYRMTLEETIDQEQCTSLLAAYQDMLMEINNDNKHIDPQALNELHNFYFYCIYPLSLLLPKKKKGKKADAFHSALYSILKPFISLTLTVPENKELLRTYSEEYNLSKIDIIDMKPYSSLYHSLLESKSKSITESMTLLKNLIAHIKSSLKSKNY